MENQKKSSKKPLILGLIALIAVIAVLLGVYFATRKPTSAGQKTIQVEIVANADATAEDGAVEKTITTDAEYLRGALDQENLIEGTESEYGLFVTTVDGITADDAKQEWWCFTKDGATLETGVDTTPIADGDHFEITLTAGY